jgi:hypothetical protein
MMSGKIGNWCNATCFLGASLADRYGVAVRKFATGAKPMQPISAENWSILWVGPSADDEPYSQNLTYAATGCEAVELLRVMAFDIVLVSRDVFDMGPWDLAESIRKFWPWQRWALLAQNPTPEEVRLAGELGAMGIFGSTRELLACGPQQPPRAPAFPV